MVGDSMQISFRYVLRIVKSLQSSFFATSASLFSYFYLGRYRIVGTKAGPRCLLNVPDVAGCTAVDAR